MTEPLSGSGVDLSIFAGKLLADGVLRGAGKMNQFMVATFTDLLLRVSLSYILPIWFGYAGIWMAFPVGWVIGTGLAIAFYCGGKWKRISIWKNDMQQKR